MSVRNLDALFDPKSIAVVGASNRAHSAGAIVMRNLLDGGFDGPIMPVNPKVWPWPACWVIRTSPRYRSLPSSR